MKDKITYLQTYTMAYEILNHAHRFSMAIKAKYRKAVFAQYGFLIKTDTSYLFILRKKFSINEYDVFYT